MTVTGVGTDFGTPTVWCAWFDGTMHHSDRFPADSVKDSPEPDPISVASKR
jgi:hypothetical protein